MDINEVSPRKYFNSLKATVLAMEFTSAITDSLAEANWEFDTTEITGAMIKRIHSVLMYYSGDNDSKNPATPQDVVFSAINQAINDFSKECKNAESSEALSEVLVNFEKRVHDKIDLFHDVTKSILLGDNEKSLIKILSGTKKTEDEDLEDLKARQKEEYDVGLDVKSIDENLQYSRFAVTPEPDEKNESDVDSKGKKRPQI